MTITSSTLTDRIRPIEVSGIGKGFRWTFDTAKPGEDLSEEKYKADIGQIASGLAEAVTAARGTKHSPIPDDSSKVPIFFIKEEDTFPHMRYVVFGSTAYVKKGQHLKAVALVQDDTCDYDPTMLENFVRSL